MAAHWYNMALKPARFQLRHHRLVRAVLSEGALIVGAPISESRKYHQWWSQGGRSHLHAADPPTTPRLASSHVQPQQAQQRANHVKTQITVQGMMDSVALCEVLARMIATTAPSKQQHHLKRGGAQVISTHPPLLVGRKLDNQFSPVRFHISSHLGSAGALWRPALTRVQQIPGHARALTKPACPHGCASYKVPPKIDSPFTSKS